MPTRFKLVPKKPTYTLEVSRFQQSLPLGFILQELTDGLYVVVPSPSPEDPAAQYLIDRGLDRLYFLTCIRFKAEMIRRIVSAEFTISWSSLADLAPNIQPQSWTYELALQLHLWSAAASASDPLLKMLLLYQIIELTYPSQSHYPAYLDSTIPPHPLTECRLLRHLLAHATVVSGMQLKRYCAFLGMPELTLDRTDSTYVNIVSSKLPLLEAQARRIIANAI